MHPKCSFTRKSHEATSVFLPCHTKPPRLSRTFSREPSRLSANLRARWSFLRMGGRAVGTSINQRAVVSLLPRHHPNASNSGRSATIARASSTPQPQLESTGAGSNSSTAHASSRHSAPQRPFPRMQLEGQRGARWIQMPARTSASFAWAAKSCGSKPVPVPSPAATQKAGRVTGSPPAAGTAPCAGQPAPLLCPRASAEHRAGQGIARLGRTKSHPTWKLCAKIPYHLSSSGSRSMAACA